jgi:hypothetical protein
MEGLDNELYGALCSCLISLGIEIESYLFAQVKCKVKIAAQIDFFIEKYDLEAIDRDLDLERVAFEAYNYDDLSEDEKDRVFGDGLVCSVCLGLIYEDEVIDQVLYNAGDTKPRNCYWSRYWGHSYCAYGPLEEKLNPYTFQESFLEILDKRKRSAHTLLLLQTAGLPWDIAWPIAALVGWML